MGLHYENLDEVTRGYITHELDWDEANANLYISPRLNTTGIEVYPVILREAIAEYNDDWLACQIRNRSLLNRTIERKKPTGGITYAKMPVNAPKTLAEGEFNRFYIRGLCERALNSGITEVVVYRGKEVSKPRPESIALIGQSIPVEPLLKDLRNSPGVDTALGMPPGPNSGLTVRLP